MTDLIRQSLGWTGGPWPPDFYTLLGFSDPSIQCEQVESSVLERMEKLRAYQLAHPESVTEAMNLLARALITLSDPAAKAEYDRQLAERNSVDEHQGPDIKSQSTNDKKQRSEDSDQGSGVVSPNSLPLWEVLGESKTDTTLPILATEHRSFFPLQPPELPPPLPVRRATQIERSISTEWLPERPRRRQPISTFRRRKDATRDRIRRVVELRKLLRAWDDAGDWLAMPDLTFATRFEAVSLIVALRAIARLAPRIIEFNGPGSAVVALAESQPSTTLLMEIADVRRQVLAKDWRAGRAEILDIYIEARGKLRSGQPRRTINWKRQAPAALVTVLASLTIGVIVWRAVRGW